MGSGQRAHVPAAPLHIWLQTDGTWREQSPSARAVRVSTGPSSRLNVTMDIGYSTSRLPRTLWGSTPGRGPQWAWRIR